MNHKISIIIPCYNIKPYLNRCVTSALCQDYKNTEIILVDDASTDGTGEMCDKLRTKDERILVIHNKKNSGLSYARNVGIDHATGDFLLFIDGDDFIDKKTCSELLKNCIQHNSDIAIGNRYTYYSDDKKYVKFERNSAVIILDSEKAIKELNNFKLYDMSACGKLFKKTLFDNIRFPVGKISEDFFIMYKLFDRAKKICCNQKPFYYYLQRNNSITKNDNICEDFIDASREQMDFIDKTYPSISSYGHIAFASANMTIYDMYLKRHLKCPKAKYAIYAKNVSDNMSYINKSTSLKISKKIQAKLFVKSRVAYNMMFWLFKKIRRA